MSIDQLLALAAQFGPMGLMVAYMIWDKTCDRRERREESAQRALLYKDDIEARTELSRSLAGLTMIIQGRGGV